MNIVPFTRNRVFLYEHLTRAKRFHCSVTGTFEYDVTELTAALKAGQAQGRSIGLVALLVKATGLLMEQHPRMNRHVFHRWWKKLEVDFGKISCTLVVWREGPGGEDILFPVLLEEPHTRSVDSIHAEIKHYKTAELSSLPQIQAFERIKKMPPLLMRWFSYKARSDPHFYLRYFGTYGLSSMITRDWGGIGGTALANTGSGFQPGVIRDEPKVVDGEIVIRKMLRLNVIADHYLLDGMDVLRAMQDLRPLLETTQLLEPLNSSPD